MDLDDIFIKSYLNEVNEKEKKRTLLSQEERVIANQKKVKLDIIGRFLQKFVDLDVMVNHSDQYTKNTKTMDGIEPQKFSFYLVDSSKTWAPGISIWFDHPAVVEIAIPNKPQEEGVVVIKVASHHPDSYLLEQRFLSFEQACQALGRFLGRCTTHIGKDTKKYVKDIQQKKQTTEPDRKSLQGIPDSMPDNFFNKPTTPSEPAVLKGTEDSSSLKKIGNLFNLNKNKDIEDEE